MVLLIDNFMKCYKTAEFVNTLATAQQFCKEAPIHFSQRLRCSINTPTVLNNYNGRPLRVENWFCTLV